MNPVDAFAVAQRLLLCHLPAVAYHRIYINAVVVSRVGFAALRIKVICDIIQDMMKLRESLTIASVYVVSTKPFVAATGIVYERSWCRFPSKGRTA